MLKITDLSHKYGESTVLSGFNAEFESNGIYVIMGPSGLGKTTLLNLISGILPVTEGRIEFSALPSSAPRISYMFQEPRLLPWMSAKDNVMLVLENNINAETRALALLDAVGLAEDAQKLPKELSGGMCQRVSFARALARESDIIILDEPFNGIDKEMAYRMIDILKERSKDALIIAVTHSEEYARLMTDKIIQL
jgi:NitT/TauT family transport system ATP-binding protein